MEDLTLFYKEWGKLDHQPSLQASIPGLRVRVAGTLTYWKAVSLLHEDSVPA